MTKPENIAAILGNIDLFLLDQLLKGNIHLDMRVLDAGFGWGNNLKYLLYLQMDVWGIEPDKEAFQHVYSYIKKQAQYIDPSQFRQEKIENMSFPDNFFQGVICTAVLHFAKDLSHLAFLLSQLKRVLCIEGLLFIRLWINECVPSNWLDQGAGTYTKSDGKKLFLPSRMEIATLAEKLQIRAYEPNLVLESPNEPRILNMYWLKNS